MIHMRLWSLSVVAATLPLLVGQVARSEPTSADTPQKTAAGTTFTLPKAWSSNTTGSLIVVSPPEADTHIAIADIETAQDAKDAATKAWALYGTARVHPLKDLTPAAAREGWDERVGLDYETSANEKLTLYAIALRKGAHWTVLIVDASNSTAEKRLAAIRVIERTLRPAGYIRESFAGKTANLLDPTRVEALKVFVQTAIDQLGVPGAAFALIDHGRLVYEGGIGVRELGKHVPVDAHTLFMVASNTKGMSTLLLAKQVDAGKVQWDEPVTEVYPSFRLGSDATTKKVLVRHLVCACTGLPRKDYEWIFGTTPNTPATMTFEQLAATEPTSGFGEVFQYNNLMASAAGYIAGHLVYPDLELGAAYDKAMQTEIFGPLDMRETTFSMTRALAGNHATPHDLTIDGKPAVAEMDFNYTAIPHRPAGGAWSSAHDMIKYVQDEITQGVLPNGQRLVSAKNLLQRRVPGVPIGEDAYYGMGLEIDSTWGVTVVHHGGSLAGYKSDILLVPDAQVGAVILTNSDEGWQLLRPFMRRLLEILYDGKPEAAGDVTAAAAQAQTQIAAERPRLTLPPAPEALGLLARRYASPELGTLTVNSSSAGTRFQFLEWGSDVASRKNDDGTVSLVTTSPAVQGVDFVTGDELAIGP